MKILFILPYDRIYKYHGGFLKPISYAPLTHAVLAALIPSSITAEVSLNDEGVEKPVSNGVYDLVVLSAATSAAPRAYELARYWRARGSYVALGGVHPTLMPEEAAQHADTVLIGFGEKIFPEFLLDLVAGRAHKLYRHQSEPGYLSMPIPRRDLLSKVYLKIPTVIANRGCLNQCAYCTINQLWGQYGIARPIGEVIAEIKALGSKRIILLDPSPTSNEAYAEEFFAALIPLKLKWSGLSTIDVVKKERLFELMIKSGCEGILAGFETIQQKNIGEIKKNTNQIEEYRAGIAAFHEHGIPILGCFMAGLDADTHDSLMETVEFINETGIDLPRFSILTPFPGTKLFEDLTAAERILTRDWALYDTMTVVFKPQKMEPAELQQTFYQMWQRAYTWRSIFKRINYTKNEKLLKLGANFGFKYYSKMLRKIGEAHGIAGRSS